MAEGYGRFHYLDRLRFFYIARGSLTETLGAFDSCQTVGYISTSEMERLRQLLYSSLRSLNGYIRWVRGQQQGKAEFGAKLVHEQEIIYQVGSIDWPEGGTDVYCRNSPRHLLGRRQRPHHRSL